MGTAKRLIISGTGYPGTTKTLQHLQESFSEPLSAIAKLVGDYTILSGLVRTGNNVSDGFISYDGTIYPVQGGVITHPNDWGFINIWGVEDALYDVNGEGAGTELLPAYQSHYLVLANDQSDYEFFYDELKRVSSIKELTEFKESSADVMRLHADGWINYNPLSGTIVTVSIPFDDAEYFVNCNIRPVSDDPNELNLISQANIILVTKDAGSFTLHVKTVNDTPPFVIEWHVTKLKV